MTNDEVRVAPLAGVLCWCGQPAIHKFWCRGHAPKCRSGAHFFETCECKGLAPVIKAIRLFNDDVEDPLKEGTATPEGSRASALVKRTLEELVESAAREYWNIRDLENLLHSHTSTICAKYILLRRGRR